MVFPLKVTQAFKFYNFISFCPGLQQKKLSWVLADMEEMLPVSQHKPLTLESGSYQGPGYKPCCVFRR